MGVLLISGISEICRCNENGTLCSLIKVHIFFEANSNNCP